METKHQIKSITGVVLFECEAETFKECVETAMRRGSDLRGSDLRGSNLRGSDLSCSDLSYSNLSCSDLRYSNLSGLNLRGSDLRGSDLSCSDLSYSNLSCSDLRYSDLSYSNLCYSNLSYSDLRGSNLRYSDLEPIKKDLIAEILKMPTELDALRSAIIEGRIDGSSYSGECACLAGTLARAKHIKDYQGSDIPCNGFKFNTDTSSPREMFFLAIEKGDTPENNGAAKIALDWVDEAIAIRDNVVRQMELVKQGVSRV